MLWWVNVKPAARRQALHGSALELLTGLGATEVILYVDDDQPTGDRYRTAADRLYDSTEFTEADWLHGFRLRR